jgi:hypothetical protein
MKVEGSRPIDTAPVRRAQRPGGVTSGFHVSGADEHHAPAAVSAPVALTAVDALIALQSIPDAMASRAKSIKRGQDLLELLEEMQEGFLNGVISKGTLQRLGQKLQTRPREFIDPQLQPVLDDIELRAQVELAKLGIFPAGFTGN